MSFTAVRSTTGPAQPSHEDPLVAATSHLIGGPMGVRAVLGSKRFWTVWRVLIALTVLTCTLGWAQKEQCRDTRNWSHADGVYQYTRLCYSDVVALYGTEGIEAGRAPYVSQPVEYPVLIGAVMELGGRVASLAGGSHLMADGQYSEDEKAATFYDVTVLLMSLAALGTVICTGLVAGKRRLWDAALFALAPTLIFHLGTNWDMLAVFLATAGLAAWSRKRPYLAGVLLGLGVAAKLYPVLFLFPMFLLCLRAGQLRAWSRSAVTTVLTAGGLYAVVWPFSPAFATTAGSDGQFPILGPSAWQVYHHGGGLSAAISALAPHHDGGANGLLRFLTLNRTRLANYESVWYGLEQATGRSIGAGSLNLAVAGALLVVAGALTALTLLAPRRPRLPQLLFLLVAAFLLTNKVYSPQYVLWLVPLAALARPRWRAILAWQAAEVLQLIVQFGFLINVSNSDTGAPYGYFAAAVLVRGGALLVLCALIVKDILRPEDDVIRIDGLDDPAGGVLDHAEDRRFGRTRLVGGQQPLIWPVDDEPTDLVDLGGHVLGGDLLGEGSSLLGVVEEDPGR